MEPKLLGQSHSRVLVAAALQDHLSRQYSITPLPRLHPSSSSSSPASRPTCRGCGKNSSKRGFLLSPPNTGQQKSTRNSNTRASAAQQDTTPVRRATRGTAVGRTERLNPEREYVLGSVPQRALSLAERLGLVDAPAALLSETDWLAIKTRSNDRGDSLHPCPICQEAFTPLLPSSQQVLLSCSHSFHRSCLHSFESFSAHKQCPLCRCHDYQTRVIFEGAKNFRHKAASKIQALWRGYRVRKWYASHQQKNPPKHPLLRRRHYQDKLSRLTAHMIQSCDQTGMGAESVMAEADLAIAEARHAMRGLDRYLAVESCDSDQWTSTRLKAQEHITSECPVCLVAFHHPPTLTPSHRHTLTPSRPVAVLSCSHLVHLPCIEALERFVAGSPSPQLCPLCRTPYTRQLL